MIFSARALNNFNEIVTRTIETLTRWVEKKVISTCYLTFYDCVFVLNGSVLFYDES